MSRAERRAAKSLMRTRRSWEWAERDITAEERARFPACRNIKRAHYNDFYSVQVYEVATEIGEVLHLIVRGQQGQEPPWRDMQRIKDELVGPEREAIQVYPRNVDIVDQADVYHLWVMPAPLPFGLHRENGLAKRGARP